MNTARFLMCIWPFSNIVHERIKCVRFIFIIWQSFWSSHPEVFYKKGKISQNSQENTCVSHYFDKVADVRPATLLNKRLWHRCFPVNFSKILTTSFFTEHLPWLLLSASSMSSNSGYFQESQLHHYTKTINFSVIMPQRCFINVSKISW